MKTFFILFSLFLCLSFAVQAADVSELNQVSFPVNDRSQAALTAGLKNAFQQVLIKLTGNPNIMSVAAIQSAAPDVEQWVQSYSYDAKNNSTQLFLTVQFDVSGLKELLTNAGQTVWIDRPRTLVILNAVPDDVQSKLQQIAQDRALPLIFPKWDISDQTILDAMDPNRFALTSTQIDAFLTHYQANALLTVHWYQEGKKFEAEGQYAAHNAVLAWHDNADSAEALLQSISNQLTVWDAKKEQATQNVESVINLNVANVDDIDSYAQMMNYLRSQPYINSVSVENIGSNGVLLSIRFTGNLTDFKTRLANEGKLKPLNVALTDNDPANLYYTW